MIQTVWENHHRHTLRGAFLIQFLNPQLAACQPRLLFSISQSWGWNFALLTRALPAGLHPSPLVCTVNRRLFSSNGVLPGRLSYTGRLVQFLLCFVFKTRSHYTAWKLASDSQRSVCFCLPSAEIKACATTHGSLVGSESCPLPSHLPQHP